MPKKTVYIEDKKASPCKIKTIYWYVLIISTFVFRGAFFAQGLFALTAFMLVYALVTNKSVKLDIGFWCFFVIAMFAALSLVIKSVDKYESFVDLQKYILLVLSYVVFKNTSHIKKIEKAVYAGIIVVMVFGLLGYIGVNSLSSMVTAKGGRLQSFLQYANTTALFLGVGAFLSVDRFLKRRQFNHLLCAVLCCVSLLLTKSRITFVLFVCVFAFYVLSSLKGKSKAIFLILLALLIITVACVGGRIIRISLTEPTLVERAITYIDAGNAVVENPVLGIGLGNWQFLSFSFQTAPYQVRYVHNMYLQIALDAGIVSFLAIVFLIVFSIVKCFKKRNIYFYIFLLVVLHSFFEINFNYGIFVVFFALTTVLMQEDTGIFKNDFKIKFTTPVKCAKIITVTVLSSILCVLWLSEMFVSSGDSAMKHMQSLKAESCYQKALFLNPANNTAYYKLAKVEKNSENAIKHLEKAVESNPYMFTAMNSLVEGYLYFGDYSAAIEGAYDLLESFPYNKAFQQLNEKVISSARESGSIDDSDKEFYTERYNTLVEEKNSAITPLYRYIDSEMDY